MIMVVMTSYDHSDGDNQDGESSPPYYRSSSPSSQLSSWMIVNIDIAQLTRGSPSHAFNQAALL